MLIARVALVLGLAGLVHVSSSAAPAGPVSGVDLRTLDMQVRPQDDLYQHVNGRWLERTEIPRYMTHWGTLSEMQLRVYEDARSLLEDLDSDASDPTRRKLADLYASFMHERTVERAGLAPLSAELERINGTTSTQGVAALLARFARLGLGGPLAISVHPDGKHPDKLIVDLEQSGLSLPDRDYYLSDEPGMSEAREKYRQHIERVLELAGDDAAAARSAEILGFETALARAQWTRVENRDPAATHNPVSLKALTELAPGLAWNRFAADAGLHGRVESINVSQPSYVRQLATLASTVPLQVWRAYFRWRLIDSLSPLLPKRFAAEFYQFYGGALSDVPVMRPRWLRAVGFVDDRMGDALGQIYVEKHFPPESRASAEKLVSHLRAAFTSSTDSLDWMSSKTRREAQAKLAALEVKIGCPEVVRDYSGLEVSRTDLVGNHLRVKAFEYQHDLDRLGKPVERGEWRMTPLQVNGYYEASTNQIHLAAALLQPPLFQAGAEDAVNYGGVGWFIAHEMSHAFDDRGRQYDGKGKLRDWWTKADHNEFIARSRALVEQYSKYEVASGVFVDGELTLGENIADNAGLAIALRAYHLSLGGAESPVIDGYSGDQRFFMSFARIWAAKGREADAIQRVKWDPHPPGRFRVNGAVANQDAFHAAFGVREGDGMYVEPGSRIRIW